MPRTRVELEQIERRILARLWQQDDKLIAAVTKSRIHAPNIIFDGGRNFGQQPAAHEMAVLIVNSLEMVKINKN